MKEAIKCCYISYEKTNLEAREKVALGQEEIKGFLTFLKERDFATEFLIISTCNRTEIYYLSEKDLREKFVRLIGEFKNDVSIARERNNFLSETDPERCIFRLFEIANGMRSQVLGDLQVISQVKGAYQLASEAGVVGSYLHRLLQTLFSCYKAVANQTNIHAGSASVSYAAMEIVRDFLKKEKSRPVLIIGAGDFSREIISQLKKKGIDNLFITNRSPGKAESMAAKFGLNTVPFHELDDLWCFDVVISCVSAPEIIVKKEQFTIHPAHRRLLIDLSVPRSIDPDLATMSGIKLINMNQITEKNKSALLKREYSIPHAREIIGEFYREFCHWELSYATRPVLNELKKAIEEIRKGEIERLLKKNKSGLAERELVENLTSNIVNKIVKLPALKLSRSGMDKAYLSQAIIKLFDLDLPKHLVKA